MTDSLLRIPAHDLRALAAALRSGRLGDPFTELAVARFVRTDVVRDAALALQQLNQAGSSAAAIAIMLDVLVRERELRHSAETAIDLVSTGPETAAVANRDTRVVVSELFAGAQTSVVVVGYAVHQGKQVFRALAERMEQVTNLAVRMYLDVQRSMNDTSLPDEVLRRFAHRFRTQEWPGTRLPEVFYDPRSLEPDPAQRCSLHAKCIVIDRCVSFISSANFTGAAQLRNIEVGVIIRSKPVSEQLTNHFESLALAGMLKRAPGL